MTDIERSMGELLPTFLAEAAEAVPEIRAAIAASTDGSVARASLGEAHRLVHNIRTGAASVGKDALSDVARPMEGELERRATAGKALTARQARRLSDRLEAVEEVLLACFDDPDAGTVDGTELAGAAPSMETSADGSEDGDQAAIPPELLEVFSLEAQDHLGTMSAALARLTAEPRDPDALAELRRSSHTLKGAAAMVGLRDVSSLAHRMEDLLDGIADGVVPPSAEAVKLLLNATDRLNAIAFGEGGRAALPAELAARFDALLGRAAAAPSAPASAARLRARRAGRARPAGPGAHPERRRHAPTDRRAGADRRAASQAVRVPVTRLDELIGLQGEVVIGRSALEGRLAELGRQVAQLDASLDRLTRTWTRFEAESLAGGGLPPGARGGGTTARTDEDTAERPEGFDVLELDRYTEWHILARQLAETAADLVEGQREIRETLSATERESTRLRRSTQDLRDRLMRLRMVPISSLSARLERIVRVTADEDAKQAAFALEGGEVAIDKPLLDRLADPLLHLLRNAVDHGVEAPAARAAAGKPEAGVIRVMARYEGVEAVVDVIDDGAGLDLEAIRAAAIRTGRMTRAKATTASREQLEALIFEAGFSTRAHVSEISGRGVGLDVVRAIVRELNGSIEARSEPGQGTTFSIRLPLTLALARVVMVRSAGETFALPVTAVEQVVRVTPDDLEDDHEALSLRTGTDGDLRTAVSLAHAIGGQVPAELPAQAGALLLKGGRRVALLVDELLDTREVVVRVLGRGLSGVPGLSGATVLGDGRVVLILDAASLLEAMPEGVPAEPPRPLSPIRGAELRVMIVDDSVSVRHVLAAIAGRAGWTAIEARDGMEALDRLTGDGPRPDLILTDIEMPRMDGFELTAAIRSDPRLRDTPVVLITSRSGEKHRARAFDLGVNDYLVKPFQEPVLVELVNRLTRAAAAASAGHDPPVTASRPTT